MSAKSSTAVKEIEVFNPATEEKLGAVPYSTTDDVVKAVEAAESNFKRWKDTSANVRAELLHGAADKMRKHQKKLIELLTLEQGKPVPENEEEMEWVINTFDYYAELGRHERGRVLPSNEPSQLNIVVKEPFGVVACILPWNYPLLLLAWKVAPALAAGNTVVIKPSELTPLSTMYMMEHCLDEFPKGVINVVNGLGPDVGETLVKHPAVRAIAFTGSVATGQRIASLAAPAMKKLHLELGGKDAFVIAEDADPEVTAKALAYSALANAGQVCTSTERVYIPQKRKKEFTEAIVEFVKKLKIGPGIEPTTDIGPMIGPTFRDKVANHVEDARAHGAKVLIGGSVPKNFDKGYYFEPTVLVDVDHSMKIMKEETFGPTIPLMEYKSFEQAIDYVNDSEFGLGACLLSSDPMKAKLFFEDVKAGTIWINDPLTDNYAGPFGGMKLSGGARELGQEGLDGFREVKHVHWEFATSAKSYWFPYGKKG
ncbi:MAG: aldehyde dehydrogenase [Candidatus Obscuribacterales bacterium]|nr:aldehyde dehydrogenase [Cyanobacteria bacterium HKST-UBA01]MCB9471967.1 aldehyde dehydrogenase [Candidatus Obscuribacterales bacterium]